MSKGCINDIEFLKCIYKNAQMGLIGIDNILSKIDDLNLKKVLKDEYEEYLKIKDEAETILDSYNEKVENISMMTKLSSAIMVDMSLSKDNSLTKIAKMMLEGTNKGIIELLAKINAYNGKEANIMNLAKKFKGILENNINELKKFL